MSDLTDYDDLASRTLTRENLYSPAEWDGVAIRARDLIDEARFLGVDLREHAAERMMTMQISRAEDEMIPPGADLARGDIAMAAALVYLGRVAP
jgi:hypothetical protein